MEAEGIMEQRSSDTTIHDLPDHILQHILSLLFSTKYAVRTCVLSKRWVYLWKDISNILLPQTGFKSRQQFINFVSRFYQVYDCSNIRSLFFCCQVGEDAPQINEWLQGFINPNIQELSVYVGETKEPLVFPEHLFTCATLTKFKVCMKHIFKIPFSIQFESLRTLTLNSIIFPDTSSTQQFFNGCPCLEVLDLYYCNWMNVDSVCICPPMLQKVTIIEGRGKDKPNEATRVSNYCNVMIDGNSLKSFSYRGDLRNDYFLYSSTSVMIASIDIHAPKSWNKNVALFVFKLLHALSNAENLSITPISLSV
ncbi:hypothetical protein RIF29_22838 [Crotalaria pallida]|uniref:F-box/LRR-repeat protein 15/At3g58940/PEG3-like LRR domain-containing protein n=1 Tax=Crotalaria pallida TaxID=3830 RepID=A0AAN9I9L6_CROPI